MRVPLCIIIGENGRLTKGRVWQATPGPLDVPEGCFVAGLEWKEWESAFVHPARIGLRENISQSKSAVS